MKSWIQPLLALVEMLNLLAMAVDLVMCALGVSQNSDGGEP